MVNRSCLYAAVSALALPGVAQAYRAVCEPPYHATHLVGPRSGATDVPTDAQIWLSLGWNADFWWNGWEEPLLVGPSGEPVTLTGPSILEIPLGGVEVWKPEPALAPDTNYQFWLCDLSTCETLLTEFRTGTGPHAGSPAIPRFLGEDASDGSGRGYFSMHVDFTGILVVDRRDGGFDGPGLKGRAVTVSADPEDAVELIYGECGNWTESRERASLRLGAYDWSGAFSGWSEPIELEMRGCSVAGAPGSPAALVLLALLRGRRRAQR